MSSLAVTTPTPGQAIVLPGPSTRALRSSVSLVLQARIRLIVSVRRSSWATPPRLAYLTDLKAWGSWCASLGIHPFDARRHHVDAWVRVLSAEPLPRTNKPMASASIARRLSAVSAFYAYGISVDVLDFSPIANVRRPQVSEDSTTVGLSADEAVTLLEAAEQHLLRAGALVILGTYNGVRIDEALAADVADYTYNEDTECCASSAKAAKPLPHPSTPLLCERSVPTSPIATHWRAGCFSPHEEQKTRLHNGF